MTKSVELVKITTKRNRLIKDLCLGDIFKLNLRHYILTPTGAVDLQTGKIENFNEYTSVTLIDIEKYC